MTRILFCLMVPFIILFVGITPAFTWAIPLAIGSIVIALVFGWIDWSETRTANDRK